MNYCAAALAPEVIRCRPRAAPFPKILRPEMELMEFHFTLPPEISTLLIWKQRGGDPGCRAAVLGGLWGQWCAASRRYRGPMAQARLSTALVAACIALIAAARATTAASQVGVPAAQGA